MLKKIFILAPLLFCSISYGENVTEDTVKAAFIFHFIAFTQWDDSSPEYYVCIPEDRPLREAAHEMFDGKLVNDRKIEVVDRTDSCHVLVSNEVPKTHSTLTIGPLDKGALLEFRMVDHKLKFAVNLAKVRDSRLKISSQMLKLAIIDQT